MLPQGRHTFDQPLRADTDAHVPLQEARSKAHLPLAPFPRKDSGTRRAPQSHFAALRKEFSWSNLALPSNQLPGGKFFAAQGCRFRTHGIHATQGQSQKKGSMLHRAPFQSILFGNPAHSIESSTLWTLAALAAAQNPGPCTLRKFRRLRQPSTRRTQ